MLKRISAITTASAAATALAVGLSPAPSSATTATTWTVSPGGSVTVSGAAELKDTKLKTRTPCKSVKLDAALKSGSGLAGAGVGSIMSGAFTGCTLGGALILSANMVVNGLPWRVNATTYASGVTTGTITGIDLVATVTGCTATLDGTAAGADNGVIRFTYTNSTGKLRLLPEGGNLHWWAVAGCLGLVGTGDPVQPSDSLTVKPEQTITSP